MPRHLHSRFLRFPRQEADAESGSGQGGVEPPTCSLRAAITTTSKSNDAEDCVEP